MPCPYPTGLWEHASATWILHSSHWLNGAADIGDGTVSFTRLGSGWMEPSFSTSPAYVRMPPMPGEGKVPTSWMGAAGCDRVITSPGKTHNHIEGDGCDIIQCRDLILFRLFMSSCKLVPVALVEQQTKFQIRLVKLDSDGRHFMFGELRLLPDVPVVWSSDIRSMRKESWNLPRRVKKKHGLATIPSPPHPNSCAILSTHYTSRDEFSLTTPGFVCTISLAGELTCNLCVSMSRPALIDDGYNDQSLPVPIQIFLWRQVSPFIRPKLGKLHEASCMVSPTF
uniref:Cation channel complex component UNC80 N-terminal domain-containing protein n=1 Tax=Timema monikensis TaxID=170555 RepID=A0A7R9E0W2_9NEOP|nr:unnamed protein product [Timema monikensis]